ncbi:MAG TPA: hypothetical protein VLW85_18900 [Myxococcales bacterium]|nr:hypothetical protein [Myxococcales bacterium]
MIAVVPFTADIDPDAHDLARWLTSETAALLARATEVKLVADEVEIAPEALGAAAAALGAGTALGASVQVVEGGLRLQALLADAAGAEKASWEESLPLGGAARLGPMLARAVLLALGDDSLAPPESVDPDAPAEVVLRLARAAAQLDVDELLVLAAEQPGLEAPRRTLLDAARAAVDTGRMPQMLSALERLVEQRPDDGEALFALAEYRALHFDEAGARAMFVAARDAADQPALGARACVRLTELAEKNERANEAIAHLRAAIKLDDDPRTYARLGALLLERDEGEGVQALTRAAVLAPKDPEILLQLARALREHGGDPKRALAAAAEAARQAEQRPDLADAIAAELQAQLDAAG